MVGTDTGPYPGPERVQVPGSWVGSRPGSYPQALETTHLLTTVGEEAEGFFPVDPPHRPRETLASTGLGTPHRPTTPVFVRSGYGL